MTIPATVVVQIDQFCNCDGCIERAKKALRKLDDVILLAMDPEIGKFTIQTTKHPQVIEYALKHPFPKKNIIVSYPHIDDIATTLVTMSQGQGLESIEYTQSSTFRFKFTGRHNQPTLSSSLPPIPGSNGVHLEYAPLLPPPPQPQANITPSAPPIPTTPDLVYGYPPEFYGLEDDPHGCCTIL